MNKKLLLGILILGFLVIGAACSKTPAVETSANTVSGEEAVPTQEEPEVLRGEIVEEEGGQTLPLVGEVDFDKDAVDSNAGVDGNSNADSTVSVRVFNVIAKRFEFIPSAIRVKKGNKVILNITSADVEHGLAIDEYKINKTIPAGETVAIEFIADKTGQFEFYSSVYAGAGTSNMRGRLVVE
ncbi:MAG: cupredoxin domain-containing protein [bacterium]